MRKVSVTPQKFNNVTKSLGAGRTREWIGLHYNMGQSTVRMIASANGSYSSYKLGLKRFNASRANRKMVNNQHVVSSKAATQDDSNERTCNGTLSDCAEVKRPSLFTRFKNLFVA